MNLNDKIVIYRTADGQTQLEVKVDKETVWLNAYQMAELFGRDTKTIRKHIDNAIREELAGDVVVAKFATTTPHGAIEGKSQTHEVNFYNLDVIISVGYRVKSKNGVEFRRWANQVLKNYLVKGYAINKSLTEQRYTELKQLVGVLGRTVKVSCYLRRRHPSYRGIEAEIRRKPMVCQRERRLVQELHWSNLPNFWRARPLSVCRGESRHAALPRHQEPFVQRRQQAHRRHPFPMVHGG